MGRKLRELVVILAALVSFSFIFASISFGQGENLLVFVHMQPEAPNSADGRFWEGPDVRIKLELRDPQNNVVVNEAFKIFYTWDNLDSEVRIEYKEPFQPIEGEHWLFAYAVNDQDKFVTPATKFFVQYRRLPPVPMTQHVYVSGETVKYGTEGLGGIEGIGEKKGQITQEATSTAKVATPTLAASNAAAALNFIQRLVSGRTNLWILLLVVGLALLVAVKVLFREKK